MKKYQRPDGSVVKFDDNACVLINKGGEPIGSRLNGVVGAGIAASWACRLCKFCSVNPVPTLPAYTSCPWLSCTPNSSAPTPWRDP